MEVLKNMIQDLALIVMLALFMEMILPTGEVKQYVKMVLGLLLAVALMQAFGGLVHRDFAQDVPFLTVREEGQKQEAIMVAGKEMAVRQQEKAAEEYRLGLSRQVLSLAQLNKKVSVTGAEVRLQEGQSPGSGRLEEIILLVRDRQAPGQAGGERPGLVEPVTVEVSPGPAGTPPGLKGTAAGAGAGSGPEGPPAEAVAGLKETLAGFYNIEPGKIKIIYQK